MAHKFKIKKPLTGLVAVVTGASSGIGYYTALALYKAGAHVVLACRNVQKTVDVIKRMEATETCLAVSKLNVGEIKSGKLEFMKLDTSDLESVRSFAKEFLAKGLPLHLLINNAGIAGSGAEDAAVSKEGYELIFVTNHLGHYLLTSLLMDKLKESAAALNQSVPLSTVRVVNVASKAYQFARGKIPYEKIEAGANGFGTFEKYAVSKLANVYFTQELASQFAQDPKLIAASLHPGVVATDIWKNMPSFVQPIIKYFMLSEVQGSYTTLHCALSDSVESGKFYDNCKMVDTGLNDAEASKTLWTKSAAMCEPKK